MTGDQYADLIALIDTIRADHAHEVAKLNQRLADEVAYTADLVRQIDAAERIISRLGGCNIPAAEDLIDLEVRQAGEAA
ncbi:MAG: hypothetical protein ACLQUT_02410 [Thermoleophilia bacterium]